MKIPVKWILFTVVFIVVLFSNTLFSQTYADLVLVARINFGGTGTAPGVTGWSDLNPWQRSIPGGKYVDAMHTLTGNDSISLAMYNNTDDHWGGSKNLGPLIVKGKIRLFNSTGGLPATLTTEPNAQLKIIEK